MSIPALAYDLRRIVRRGANIQVREAATALTPASKITSITDDGANLATVVATAHGFSTSDSVVVFGAYEPRFNGTFTVTVTDANTFTYALATTAAGTAAGDLWASESATIPVAERFNSFGHIKDATLSFEEVTTSKATSGKSKNIGTDFTLKFMQMQTSDVEFAAADDLVFTPVDIVVVPKGCPDGQADQGVLMSQLQNGFLLYDQTISVGGELDLGGGESGIEITVTFFVGNDQSEIVVGG